MSLLRESVWIIKGKILVRMVIQNCSFCKQRQVTPQLPIMSNLSDACLAINQPPFTNTRIDYFGPLTIKQGRHTRSTDGTSRSYGAVFTCLSTRAVQIERVDNLSTDNFMLALHQFLSMRGHPKNNFSDNRTNFTGAQGELSRSLKSLNQYKIEVELTTQKIIWNLPTG